MTNIKFSLVGCGRIAPKHFESIERVEGAEIIACCDKVEARAKEAAEKYNIANFYTDYNKMLGQEKVDGVIICTPSGLHTKMGIKAARQGYHVITEC